MNLFLEVIGLWARCSNISYVTRGYGSIWIREIDQLSFKVDVDKKDICSKIQKETVEHSKTNNGERWLANMAFTSHDTLTPKRRIDKPKYILCLWKLHDSIGNGRDSNGKNILLFRTTNDRKMWTAMIIYDLKRPDI